MKARNLSCHLLSCCICLTTTRAARVPDKARPPANVADNDLALGRVVDAVSHSPFWDDTAIFVLEDDAQNGRRSRRCAPLDRLVISKYSPGSAARPNVEHRFYTTVNMVHTIEVLLGLPPMNQNDAYAPSHERTVHRSGRSARVQGGFPQPAQWTHLRDQPQRCSRGEHFIAHGFLAARCSQCREFESSALAGSERLCADAEAQAHCLS